jgi:hypothetical protein
MLDTLQARPSDDWLLTLTPPTTAPWVFTVVLPDGRTFTDRLPSGLSADLPPWPGTEPWNIPGLWPDTNTPSVPAAPPPPSPPIRAFQTAVTGLASTDLKARTDTQALADLHALFQTTERLRVAHLDWLIDAQDRNLSRLDSEVSLRTWVRRRFDDAPRTDLPLSNTLRRYPLLQAQVKDGAVGVEAAAMVSTALTKVGPRLDREGGLIDGLPGEQVLAAVIGHVVQQVAGARLGLPDGHPLLTELQQKTREVLEAGGSQLSRLEAAYSLLGEHVPLQNLKACLLEQTDALLPVALEDRSLRASDSRGLTLTPNFGTSRGGRVVIDTDDELYELLYTALGAEARRDPANPTDTALKADATQQTDDFCEKSGEGRQAGQAEPADDFREKSGEPAGRVEAEGGKRADAFGETPGDLGADVESQGDVRFPRSTRQRGHDALKLVLQRYLAAGLAGSHDKAPVSLLVTLTAGLLEGRPGALPARAASGRPLPASLLRQWWCDTTVTALVLSEGLIPLGITHTGRTLTPHERRASLVQHGHGCSGLRCCTPGDPLTTLIPHHVRKYAIFGQTSLEETIWACPRLHHGIHHGQTLPLRDGRWINEHGWTNPPH